MLAEPLMYNVATLLTMLKSTLLTMTMRTFMAVRFRIHIVNNMNVPNMNAYINVVKFLTLI